MKGRNVYYYYTRKMEHIRKSLSFLRGMVLLFLLFFLFSPFSLFLWTTFSSSWVFSLSFNRMRMVEIPKENPVSFLYISFLQFSTSNILHSLRGGGGDRWWKVKKEKLWWNTGLNGMSWYHLKSILFPIQVSNLFVSFRRN